MPGSDLEAEIAQIQERLREIRAELGRDGDPGDSPIDELLEEERRLLVRLQEISDRVSDESTGLAERLVRQEGASPEEFPDLPSERSGSE